MTNDKMFLELGAPPGEGKEGAPTWRLHTKLFSVNHNFSE